MIPMIVERVVVLPMPLRPSSVTTSPESTAKSTPNSTLPSPYPASSALTSSILCNRAGLQHEESLIRERLSLGQRKNPSPPFKGGEGGAHRTAMGGGGGWRQALWNPPPHPN